MTRQSELCHVNRSSAYRRKKENPCALYPGPNLSRCLHAEYRRPYLLRNLRINHEDQVWGIDISCLPLKTGFMYLFIIIDWYTRQNDGI